MIIFISTLLSVLVPSMALAKDSEMDSIAKSYVLLALELDAYDKGYVDAYIGPEEWKKEVPAKQASFPIERFQSETQRLLKSLDTIEISEKKKIKKERIVYLQRMISALAARVALVQGKSTSFNQQAMDLYDVMPPTYSPEQQAQLRQELEKLLPGSGTLASRFEAYREKFRIAEDKLAPLFSAAISEARSRTKKHISLPKGEKFEVEYVKTDAGWSAYNWYKGNYTSTIQINTSVPIYVDQIVHYASHEGYPGHHVQNILREKHLIREKGWLENSMYPLFAPTALFFEGSADYGASLAFPEEERISFEKKTLFPMAGLDPVNVETYFRVMKLRKQLSNEVTIDTARLYLEKKITKEQAVRALVESGLETPRRAENRVRFYDNYGAYVVNYHLGEELVADYVNRHSRGKHINAAWKVLYDLYSTPKIPSSLKK